MTRSKPLTLSALLAGLVETALAADPGVAEQMAAPDTGFGGGQQWKLTLGDYWYGGYSGQDFNFAGGVRFQSERPNSLHVPLVWAVRPPIR